MWDYITDTRNSASVERASVAHMISLGLGGTDRVDMYIFIYIHINV